jgi:hypothetical protein
MSSWNSFESAARGYDAKYHGGKAASSSSASKRTADVLDVAPAAAPASTSSSKASAAPPAAKKPASAGNWLAAAKPKAASTQLLTLWSAHAAHGSGAKSSLIVRRDPLTVPRTKIAAFDFDGTLTDNAGHATSSVLAQQTATETGSTGRVDLLVRCRAPSRRTANRSLYCAFTHVRFMFGVCARFSVLFFCACCAQVSQYRLWCETVVPTLQRYHAEGYALLVVSNQNAIKSVR